jgi:nitrous oxidase accessory protein NosD
MIRRIFSFVAAFALTFAPGTVAPPIARAASTVLVVGKNAAECPDAQFSAIQDAVNAAAPGTIIRICAGTYPEQVSINKAMRLRGENGVVIQPSNVTANSTSTFSGQPIAAIILVKDATDVDVNDLIIDGTNGGITQCAPDYIGVFYRTASGEVSRVAVRNVKLSVDLNGCQSGSAILVQSGGGGTSEVEIEDSSVHDYQKNGITANEVGTEVRIEGNVVTGIGPTTGAAQNGIQIGFGAEGNIARNAVANHIWSPCVSLESCTFTADDILVFQSDNVRVDGNEAGVSQTGIAIVANHARAASNHVFDSLVFDGIELIGNDNEARHNRITHSDQAGVFIQGNNNVVAQNRINEAAFGVLKTAGSTSNVITNDDFFNAAVKVQDPSVSESKVSPYR